MKANRHANIHAAQSGFDVGGPLTLLLACGQARFTPRLVGSGARGDLGLPLKLSMCPVYTIDLNAVPPCESGEEDTVLNHVRPTDPDAPVQIQ